MQVSEDGKVTHAKFVEAVMCSKARLTYSQVNDFLTGNDNAIPKEAHGPVRNLHALYKAFAKARGRRGALELDLPQIKFELNKDGEIDRIRVESRNDAHRLIEECMIAANVEAAKFLKKNRIQGLYRVHPKPDPDRFDELRLYLVSLGIKVPHPDHIQPRQFNNLLKKVKDRPDSAAMADGDPELAELLSKLGS